MNSVFSAFKSNKIHSSRSSTSISSKEINTANYVTGKKNLNIYEKNNYEKLRHIREKTSSLLMDDEEIILRKTATDDSEDLKYYDTTHKPDGFVSANSTNSLTDDNCMSESLSLSTSSSSLNTILYDSVKKYCFKDNCASENNLLSKCYKNDEASNSVHLSAKDKNISGSGTNFFILKSMSMSETNGSTPLDIFNNHTNSNNLKKENRNRLRLSSSNVMRSADFCQQPAVHGRLNTNGLPTGRTRLSTHQRNLSLDFRSMGILLPPVSQVTNNRMNMTQHHRNRSLDSALQRIPEVEGSSPSTAEAENALRNVSSQTVCQIESEIVKLNPKNISDEVCQHEKPQVTKSSLACSLNKNNKLRQKEKFNTKNNKSKMREDLTSLGSDDSGIICSSESDKQSLNKRCSHESLDSGKNEQSESEECKGVKLENDDEYNTTQTHLSCSKQSHISTELSDESENESDTIRHKKNSSRESNSHKVEISKKKYFRKNCVPVNNEAELNVEAKELLKDTQGKDTDIFKSFFFKNAIFRTAQSIIENHEKKNGKNKEQSITSCSLEQTNSQDTKKRDYLPKSKVKSHNASSASVVPIFCKGSSTSSLSTMKVPGSAQIMVKDSKFQSQIKTERGQSGLLRFFESPVFNIHFAVHYLFYSKEPGVLSFIANKIFSFPNADVDLYIPQLILMYIQIDELADVLDSYLVYRCRQSVDFSLKCSWLLEAYNFNMEEYLSASQKFRHLNLMRKLYPKRERKSQNKEVSTMSPVSHYTKTHHRSQSDATGILFNNNKKFVVPLVKLSLGDLSSGRAFDNGCLCFESQRGTVNDLLGQQTECSCGAPKLASEKEFLKALIDIGKILTSLPTKIEKTSRLRVLLNLINKNLPARVWLPLNSAIPHHVVRITEEKTAILNSKDKTPYIIYVEVVDVADIFTSPIISKIMPSLRHTKSDEHLDQLGDSVGDIDKESKTIVNHKIDVFNEENIWSQEDDEITAQYLQLHRKFERDTVSQLSLESCDSTTKDISVCHVFNIGDVRVRHCRNLNSENTKPFRNDPNDPSAAILREPWNEKERQIRESSPYGHLQNWRLLSAIVKSGDDLRQELMAIQLLTVFKQIWDEENITLWVRPYQIVCLSNDSGLIEPILNTVSLHQIKKNSNKSLREYFINEFGGEASENFKQAQKNFMQSCAAYCLISYLLQLKDRHNGNILLHSDGHIIHIDFGFILSISPKNLGFEQSPFKLTPEFLDVMDGPESQLYCEFKHLLLVGLKAARKQQERIVNIVEIMRSGSQLPCFKNGSSSSTVGNLRNRFHMNLTEQELDRKVDQLIQDSLNSLSTKLYDGYQYLTNGIL